MPDMGGWLNSLLTSLVLFFLYKLVRKTEKYGSLSGKIKRVERELAHSLKTLNKDLEQVASASKSLIEIHQSIGVLKRDVGAFFQRVDDLRQDLKDLRIKFDEHLKEFYDSQKHAPNNQ